MSCNRQIALSSYASGLAVGAAVTATTVLLAKKLFGLNTGSEVMYCALGGAAGVCMGAWVGRAVAGAVLARKQTWTKTVGAEVYETQLLVDQYTAFHYCPPNEYMSYTSGPDEALDFPRRCARLCLQYKPDNVLSRALDLGCAVGRSTFELACEYDEVIGLDFSEAFVRTSQALKEKGEVAYALSVEGDLEDHKVASVDPAINRDRVTFAVGDACDLAPDLGKFGCVFASNLICRLPDPHAFFSRLPDLVEPGGLLFITSPYSWLESYTEKSKWLGGYRTEAGEEVRGFSTLKKILEPTFDLVAEQDMPFLIRETVRRHQWTVTHATIWSRKAA